MLVASRVTLLLSHTRHTLSLFTDNPQADAADAKMSVPRE